MAGGKVYGCSYFGNNVTVSLKGRNNYLVMQQFWSWGFIYKKLKL
jgi:hypothetical protein